MTKCKRKRGGAQLPDNHDGFSVVALPLKDHTDEKSFLNQLMNSDEFIRHRAFEMFYDDAEHFFSKISIQSLLIKAPEGQGINSSLSLESSDKSTFELSLRFADWPGVLQKCIPQNAKHDIQLMFHACRALFHFISLSDGQDVQDKYINMICRLSEESYVFQNTGIVTIWTFCSWYYLALKWPYLDQWKVDKFLYYIRQLFNATMKLGNPSFCIALFWNFYSNSKYKGIAIHIIDVFLETCSLSPQIPQQMMVALITDLFFKLESIDRHDIFHKRVVQWVLMPLINGTFKQDVFASLPPKIVEKITQDLQLKDIDPNRRHRLHKYLNILANASTQRSST